MAHSRLPNKSMHRSASRPVICDVGQIQKRNMCRAFSAVFVLAVFFECYAVEPNRYYQTVSNDIVNRLFELGQDGKLTDDDFTNAVNFALSENATQGAIVSQSNVTDKTAMGIRLLQDDGLTAQDKCRELIHDIDVVGAYHQNRIPREPAVNTPKVMNEIDEANKKHRVKIDSIKKLLESTRSSKEMELSSDLVLKSMSGEWVKGKSDLVISEIKFNTRGQAPDGLLNNIRDRINQKSLARPVILEIMKMFTEKEMEGLILDKSSDKLLRFALLNHNEIDREVNFIISVAVKEFQVESAR